MARIEQWLDMQRPEIRKNCKVVECNPLHISNRPIRRFTPAIGTRQMKEEDRTIPRVCCGMSLFDCIYGHTAVLEFAISNYCTDINGRDKGESSRVFNIYSLGEGKAIKPNTKLVPDCDVTNEVWVVGYSPEQLNITPKLVGKFILVDINYRYNIDEDIVVTKFYIKNDVELLVDKDNVVKPGCYSLTVEGELNGDSGRAKIDIPSPISESEWAGTYKKATS